MTDPSAQQPYETPAGAPQQPAAPGAPLTAAEDKQWAMLAHFGNIIPLIPALIIFLVFRDRGPLVKSESKEALNWTINITGLLVISGILQSIFLVIPFGFIISLLLMILSWLIYVVNFIFAIVAGVKVNNGGTYRYPLNYRWIK